MYDLLMSNGIMFGFGGIVGFLIGQKVTKWPSEQAMMDRLVIEATQRRMLGVTQKDIEHNIETRVEANLNKI
jgi:hypothetical protein